MAILTQRQRDILIYLLSRGENVFTQVSTIAASQNIGDRSVRNDLRHIEDHAHLYGLRIERRPSQGLRLVGSPEDKQRLRSELSSLEGMVLTPDQRIAAAVAMLLVNEICTYQDIADACLVSRQTVVSMFPQIERELHNERLTVEKMQGTGLSLKGPEPAFRHCFLKFAIASPSTDITERTLAQSEPFRMHVEHAQRIVDEVEQHLGAHFLDRRPLELALTYMLQRIDAGHILPEDSASTLTSSDYSDFEKALVSLIPQPSERSWACSVLLSQRMGWENDTSSSIDQIDDEAEEISRELVDALGKMHDIDIAATRHLVDSLTVHLRAAIHRARNNIQLGNEHAQQVKVSVPLLYEFTRQQVAEIGPRFGLSFSEGEIAYIAMYLASIFETSEQRAMTLRVLLACSFGVATSTILKARIARMLPDCTLMGPVPVSEAKNYVCSHDVDLVISTIAIPGSPAPVLVVNPMLTQGDIDLIKDTLYQSSYSKLCSHFLSLYATTAEAPERRHEVSDYVRREDIQVVSTCETWQGAIRLAAQPLVGRDLLEPRYVEAMVRAVTDFGTYMVLTPETAYVHAGIDDGIWGDCAAVLTMQTPISFGALNPKSIRTIVVLGIRNKDKSDLLNLAQIFDKPENCERLRRPCITPDEIWHMHD